MVLEADGAAALRRAPPLASVVAVAHANSACTPGKVEVVGVQEVQGTEAFVLRFLQCRDDEWIGKVFFAKFDPKAIWYDDLEPLPGMSLPWEEAGLPRPCVDEPCQVEWMDEFLEPVYPLEVV